MLAAIQHAACAVLSSCWIIAQWYESVSVHGRYWIEMLIAAGWSNKAPTLWLAEGLLMYLTQKSSEHLLQDMAGQLESYKGALTLCTHVPSDSMCAVLVHSSTQPL